MDEIKLIPNQKLAPSKVLTRKFQRKFRSISIWTSSLGSIVSVIEIRSFFLGVECRKIASPIQILPYNGLARLTVYRLVRSLSQPIPGLEQSRLAEMIHIILENNS